MIEILNENQISARKIYRDMNAEEARYLLEIFAEEMPEETLMAVTKAVHNEITMQKALDGLSARK